MVSMRTLHPKGGGEVCGDIVNKKRIQHTVLIVVLSCLTASVNYCKISRTIREIYSMSEAQEVLDQADENTLVLYDIDKTLVIPIDAIIHNVEHGLGKRVKDSWELTVKHRIEHLWSKVLLQAQLRVIEPVVVDSIRVLQQRGVMVLGFTARGTGRYGTISSLAEYCFNSIQALGVQFCEKYGLIEFPEFTGEFDGNPMLYRGILMTNGVSKGTILGALFDYLQYQPHHIIFFDDLMKNIVSVQQEVSGRGIRYHGYHYRAIEKIPAEINSIVAQFQLDYLAQHEVWLSEEQAQQMLAHAPISRTSGETVVFEQLPENMIPAHRQIINYVQKGVRYLQHRWDN